MKNAGKSLMSVGYGDGKEAAMEAIRKTRFRPAKQRERAVGVWISIPVNFRLK